MSKAEKAMTPQKVSAAATKIAKPTVVSAGTIKVTAQDPDVPHIESYTKVGPRLTDDDGRPRPQSTVITEIGQTHHLFHDDGGDAYAAVPAGDGVAVLPILSSDYADLLSRKYFRLAKKGANRNAIGDARNTLVAMAKYDGPREPVFLRVGKLDERIVIDVGDDQYRAIEVTADGWHVTAPAAVKFRRSGKPSPLPIPTVSNIELLWRVINVAEADRPLVLAWLLAALRSSGPYPILLLAGEQGSAKSTTTRILKMLVDPATSLLRPPVNTILDLQVAARSSWVLALDNLSGFDAQIADALCRISTGGSLACRKLYTNYDEILIELQRPIILNGIDELASRPDLAQRCIQIELPVIPETERRTEAAVMADFKTYAGAIFAALLDGVSMALRDVDKVKPDRLPRMADFAVWAAAGLPALGYSAESFLSAYRLKSAEAVEDGLESSALARALRRFIEPRCRWQGSKLELLVELAGIATDYDRSLPGWPRSPKGLTNDLRRLAPSLRHIGITFENERSREARQIVLQFTPIAHMCKAHEEASQASSVTPVLHSR